MNLAAKKEFPVLRGFEHISRSWDKQHDMMCARVAPGEFYITREQECISTVLGSCIAACIRNVKTGTGGMNHFMLPGNADERGSAWKNADALETRFGVAAMESLINEILKQGARKSDLEVKLFGGGEILNMQNSRVGKRNVEFALSFMQDEGFEVVSQDLGGPHPRKIIYFPETGKVLVKRLRAIQTATIVAQENKYVDGIDSKQSTGSIELFD